MTSTETGWGFRRENQNFVASTLQLRSLQQVPGIKRTDKVPGIKTHSNAKRSEAMIGRRGLQQQLMGRR